MEAKVLKLSESGKSMFVNVKLNKFDTVGIAGYVNNPNGEFKVGDVIENFPKPTGVEHRNNENGEVMVTKTNEPLSFLKFS